MVPVNVRARRAGDFPELDGIVDKDPFAAFSVKLIVTGARK